MALGNYLISPRRRRGDVTFHVPEYNIEKIMKIMNLYIGPDFPDFRNPGKKKPEKKRKKVVPWPEAISGSLSFFKFLVGHFW